MSPTDYKQRHPIAWIAIGAVALFAVGAALSMQGLLPFGPQPEKLVCNECGVVEAVRTVETPMAALPETALEQSVTDDATSTAAAAGTTPDAAAPDTQVSFSYETTVRYENGTTGVFNQAEPPSWAPGDKVKVVDGSIVLTS